MLEQTDQGAVLVEGDRPLERVLYRVHGSQQLGRRDCSQPEHRVKVDTKPRGPYAERSLLRDGHHEPDLLEERVPLPDKTEGSRDPDHHMNDVVGVHEARVESHLVALGTAPPLQTESPLAPLLEHGSRVALCTQISGLQSIHASTKYVQQRLRGALGNVGGGVTTKAEDPLRDEAELAVARRLHIAEFLHCTAQEYPRKFRVLLRCEAELREVILGVVRQQVYRLSQKVGVTAQPGCVALEVCYGGLDLLRELARSQLLLQRKVCGFSGGRQLFDRQPGLHLRASVRSIM